MCGEDLPFGVLEERYEELDGGRRCDRGEAWSSDSTHLVERTVGEGLAKRKFVNRLVVARPWMYSRLQARRYRYSNSTPIVDRLDPTRTQIRVHRVA